MLIRRGPPLGVQIVFILATILAFFYGYILYNKVLAQLEDLEKSRGSLIIEKEDFLRDLRALREKESELNEKLTEGKESYEKLKTDYEELQEAYENFKIKKKADFQSFQAENKDQQEKIRFLTSDLEEAKSNYEKQLEDYESFKLEASKKLSVKEQECQNDMATIKDELANCKRKIEASPTKSTKKTEKIHQEVNKEAEDQKLQIAEPVDKVKGNSSLVQGGLLKGQDSSPQAEQVNPPKLDEAEEGKGERSQGEGGFHEGGNKEGQIKAPEGREEGAENKGEEDDGQFKPLLPDAANDGDNLDKKALNNDFNDGDVENEKEKSAIDEETERRIEGADDENAKEV